MFKFTLMGCAVALIGSTASAGIPTLSHSVPTFEGAVILAQTNGQERRDDRQDDRGERQDCRQDEGVAGKDKRDCKQEEVRDGVRGNRGDDNDNGKNDNDND